MIVERCITVAMPRQPCERDVGLPCHPCEPCGPCDCCPKQSHGRSGWCHSTHVRAGGVGVMQLLTAGGLGAVQLLLFVAHSILNATLWVGGLQCESF